MKKIFISILVLGSVMALPGFAHAYGNYADCVVARNKAFAVSASFGAGSSGQGYAASFLYHLIEECNSLPDAPSVTPVNMTITDAMRKVMSQFPIDDSFYYDVLRGTPIGSNPYVMIASGLPAPTTPTTQPSTPPVNQNTNPPATGDTGPTVGGVPSTTTPTCPPSDEPYLVNQIAPLRASNQTLQESNTALTTQLNSLQIQLSGAGAQITNLTKQLAQAQADLKAMKASAGVIMNTSVAPEVAPAPVVQTIEVTQPEVTTPAPVVKPSLIQRSKKWVAHFFK